VKLSGPSDGDNPGITMLDGIVTSAITASRYRRVTEDKVESRKG